MKMEVVSQQAGLVSQRAPAQTFAPASRPSAEQQSAFLPVHLLYRAGIVAVYAIILLTIVLNVEVNRKSPAFILLCIALPVEDDHAPAAILSVR